VYDTNQERIAGVSIKAKIGGNNAFSDSLGRYRIVLSSPSDVLMFSHVGYLSKEVPYNNQRVMDVVLDANLSQLDEVVVVGYGTAKRRDLTGAIHSVDAKVFQNQSSTQLTEMLAGTVAGFNTNQGTTAAGGGSLEVRGRTSLNAATDPVIVIDGVIYKGSLRDINPNDIETVDILKDASSAAVVGAQAAP